MQSMVKDGANYKKRKFLDQKGATRPAVQDGREESHKLLIIAKVRIVGPEVAVHRAISSHQMGLLLHLQATPAPPL